MVAGIVTPCLGGLELNDELEFGRLLDGRVPPSPTSMATSVPVEEPSTVSEPDRRRKLIAVPVLGAVTQMSQLALKEGQSAPGGSVMVLPSSS
jgi:hypothetical protein